MHSLIIAISIFLSPAHAVDVSTLEKDIAALLHNCDQLRGPASRVVGTKREFSRIRNDRRELSEKLATESGLALIDEKLSNGVSGKQRICLLEAASESRLPQAEIILKRFVTHEEFGTAAAATQYLNDYRRRLRK